MALQPVALRPILEEMHGIIRSAVPDEEEVISYMIPCYKLSGFLVGFGKHAKGCSFYSMHATIGKVFPKKLKGYDVSASTIHFAMGKNIYQPVIGYRFCIIH
jgi:uncharacterized protein YdhG (YjbR/CyaY superfamily)